jgi:quinoprotein glucose dehydrogenase
VLVLCGVVIAGGGFWLMTLGGSWYYAIAGVGLIASGVFLIRQERLGVWIYAATWVFTLLWSFWEVGFDGWALVPRLVAPSVLLILTLVTLPLLGGGYSRRRWADSCTAAGLFAFLAAGGGAAILLGGSAGPVRAQEAPAVTPAPTMEVEQSRIFTPGADWPVYGGSVHALRYSPLDEITPENVGQLEKVWSYHTRDIPDKDTKSAYAPENTPLKVGDSLYLCSAMNILIALDARTGEEKWRYDPEVSSDAVPYGASCRGVAYYEVPNAGADETCAARIMEGTLDARLIAVDAATGEPCAGFGKNGVVDLNEGIGETVPGWYAVTAPPTILRGIAVIGAQVKDGQAENAPSGVIRGYNATTGELAWAWDMGKPELTGAPPQGETYTRGTPNMWTMAAADPALGLVYLPMGNSSVDYWGGDREDFENKYSTALVAIDVTTGKPAWHFQTVHYDLWDYDLGSQPTLIDLPRDGGAIPAIILPSKQGQIYVLNRETGEPLFPVEEREVPIGGVEAERLSRTQPYSDYAQLNKPRLTEADMWGMTPIDQLWCRIQFRRAYYEGEYSAPTAERHFIQYPGYNGGSDWGSVAVDPVRGILVANYNDMPNYNRLIPREEANEMGLRSIAQQEDGAEDVPGRSAEGEGDPQIGAPYAIDVNAGWRVPLTGLLCKKPPYGHIRAIDLATGRTLWDRPFGSAENNGPFGIPSLLPIKIGTPNNGGSVLTAGGLIFIAATTDDKFRAIDIETGETVWETTLPAGGQTNPMTYEVDGRQYVAIAPGGHHFMETKIGDEVIAYALPEKR